MSFIDELRQEREEFARVLKNHRGIRKMVEELYPDNAHFIYELLQNAEDTGATAVSFALARDKLTFEHNGRPFEQGDIKGITDIGEGTKADDNETIGRFGIGFKAVFAYSETPHIWSPTFSFKISDLVVPTEIPNKTSLKRKTRFEFPFNNPKKTPESCYTEIKTGLACLNEMTLLFLNDIGTIDWRIDDEQSGSLTRKAHSECHIELKRALAEKETNSSAHFLVFKKPVAGLERQNIAIAFHLEYLKSLTDKSFKPTDPLSHQFKIIPAIPGRVSVYFPAEKETSGLRFHLHAPFVPELSRASIKDTSANLPLYKQLADLAAESLPKIRDFCLLTGEFLAALPNPQDSIAPRYEHIRASIILAMNDKPLTPTHSGRHAPAIKLLQSTAAFKKLLSSKEVNLLLGGNSYEDWAIGAPQKSNQDRFLSGLQTRNYDSYEFLCTLLESMQAWCADEQDEVREWFESKPAEWHQILYALINAESDDLPSEIMQDIYIHAVTHNSHGMRFSAIDWGFMGNLRWAEEELLRNSVSILDLWHDIRVVRNGMIYIRCRGGIYKQKNNCYLPVAGKDYGDELTLVDEKVYTSGKSEQQQESARRFLESIGVRKVSEHAYIQGVLEKRYTRHGLMPNNSDLERFIKLVEETPHAASLFLDYFIFENQDGKWCKPGGIYLDNPYKITGLSVWYAALGDKAQRYPLSTKYKKFGIKPDRLARFSEAVGAQSKLDIEKVSCRSHPNAWKIYYNATGKKTKPDKETDDNFNINGLELVLESPSIELSKLLWDTLTQTSLNWTNARYCRNTSQPYQKDLSTLAYNLKNHRWIPQINGDLVNFVKPVDASIDKLPGDFPVAKGWSWLTAIGFGENDAAIEQERFRQSEEEKKRQDEIRKSGFPDEASLENGKWFANLPPEEQERIKAERERKCSTELPIHSPKNPLIRAEKVGEEAKSAFERLTEQRVRSVSVGKAAVTKDANQYLQHQYTNLDGAMICQVCQDILPFKLSDGSYYFEAVEFLGLRKRHHQNHLALCPNHAAMFKHANGSAETLLELVIELEGTEFVIELAGNEERIYFTDTHIIDLKAVISADASNPEESNDEDNDDPPEDTDDVPEQSPPEEIEDQPTLPRVAVQAPKITKSRPEMVKCPHCSSSVSKKRLNKHISNVHGKKQKTPLSPSPPPIPWKSSAIVPLVNTGPNRQFEFCPVCNTPIKATQLGQHILRFHPDHQHKQQSVISTRRG